MQINMNRKPYYSTPRTCFSELEGFELVCDSYNSGIDDFDYEELDWTDKP